MIAAGGVGTTDPETGDLSFQTAGQDLPSSRLTILEFYAVHDLHPFPEDIPSEHIALGGIDIAEYHRSADVLHSCLSKVGVEASYFSDWTVPPERHDEVLRCLEASSQAMSDEARRQLAVFIEIVRRAEGYTLLAVCD